MAINVTFRKEKDGGILAVFEGHWSITNRELASYAHIGQHGPCSYDYYLNKTTPAQPEEYAPLLEELKQVGYIGEYALNIVKRLNYKKIFKLR